MTKRPSGSTFRPSFPPRSCHNPYRHPSNSPMSGRLVIHPVGFFLGCPNIPWSNCVMIMPFSPYFSKNPCVSGQAQKLADSFPSPFERYVLGLGGTQAKTQHDFPPFSCVASVTHPMTLRREHTDPTVSSKVPCHYRPSVVGVV